MLRPALGVLLVAACSGVFVSNLDPACVRCLCEAASGCNETVGCHKGYCGPFWVSRIYWAEAGKVVFPDDDPERPEAYQDCANSYDCAAGIVEHYMAEVGKDCDGDGVTDCDDYVAIHYNGAYSCDRPLRGTAFLARYERCRPASRPPPVRPYLPGGYLGAGYDSNPGRSPGLGSGALDGAQDEDCPQSAENTKAVFELLISFALSLLFSSIIQRSVTPHYFGNKLTYSKMIMSPVGDRKRVSATTGQHDPLLTKVFWPLDVFLSIYHRED